MNRDILTWCGVQYHPDGKWVDPDVGNPKKALLTDSDLCIVGLPYDAGQTGVSGQSAAPGAIRRLETFDSFHTHDIGDLSTVKVVDIGDLEIDRRYPVPDLRASMNSLNAVWPNTKTLLALGGDHSITAALLQDYHNYQVDSSEKVTWPIVIHLDAHTDTWPDHDSTKMNYPNHASWVGWVVNERYIDRIYQFGIRSMGPDENAPDNVVMHTGPLNQKQAAAFVRHLNLKYPGRPVYLSIDMDVVDPAFCPGVAYPEPGGWTSRELLSIIEFFVSKLNIIGVDIVEITPSLDVRDMSVRLAHRSVLAVMRGIKRKQVG